MSVPIAEVEPNVGGRYRIRLQTADGETFTTSGSYREMVPDQRLVFTWQWEDSDLQTLVTVELTARDGGTDLSLIHEGFPDQEMQDKHEEGWNGCLAGLDAVCQ